MSRWLVYFKERFPLPVYGLLCAGYAFSGFVLAFRDSADGVGVGKYWTSSHLGPTLLVFTVILLFFFLLRMMDELKDFAKDQLAHPMRPLPRGLFSPSEFSKMIRSLWSFGLVGGLASTLVVAGPPAGFFFILFWMYLWGMYKEFYFGTSLQNYPILYAVSHQVILLPIGCFAVAAFGGDKGYSPAAALYGVAVLGSFFSYEVGRKLDPKSPAILKTYLTVYGPKITALLLAGWQVVALLAVCQLKLSPWLMAIEVAALLSAFLIFWKPEKYKLVELLVSVSLVAHIWLGLATGDL